MDNGMITHKRVTEELAKAEEKSIKARASVMTRYKKEDERDITNVRPNVDQAYYEQSTNHRYNHSNNDKEPLEPSSLKKNKKIKKQKKGVPVTLSQFIENCELKNEDQIPKNDEIFHYASDVGLNREMLEACWFEFKSNYLDEDANGKLKKYVYWRKHYRKFVKKNWYNLWRMKKGEEAQWTTAGEQTRREMNKKNENK